MSDWNSVAAISSAVYGAATIFLVIQLWLDRRQRENHHRAETAARKLNELHGAFYEAWGYWEGWSRSVGAVQLDASQIGRQFEAVIRLECQLRLNGYRKEANELGLVSRADTHRIPNEISQVGVALGLVSGEYREAKALGFQAK